MFNYVNLYSCYVNLFKSNFIIKSIIFLFLSEREKTILAAQESSRGGDGEEMPGNEKHVKTKNGDEEINGKTSSPNDDIDEGKNKTNYSKIIQEILI